MKVARGVRSVKELIPFMNKVFHKHFTTLLPKLYTTDMYAQNHYFVSDGDRLVGTLASIPTKVIIGGDTLDARGVGMVAADKKCRGKGIMSNMLKAAIHDAIEENVDYMFLSGNRQRYEHYGFVPCGYKYDFYMSKVNYRHMTDDLEYTFEPLDADSPYLKDVTRIYNSMAIRYERVDFLKTVHSWNINKVYVVFDKGHNVIGHLATIWGKIVDYSTSEPQNLAYIVKAFANYSKRYLGHIEVSAGDPLAVSSMAKYAQTSKVIEPAFFNVLRYRHTLEVLARCEANAHGIVDFGMNIVIENRESFSIECHDNVVTTGEVKDILPTYTLKANEATLMLFSPTMSANSILPFCAKLFIPMCDNV